MKAVVTGASGFIGSHLVERLIADGHSVVAIDYIRPKILKQFINNKKFSFRVIDITKHSRVLQHLFSDTDWVFHLAGRSDIVPSITHPIQYHDVNVTGTINILEASRQAKIKKFVYAASSSCYGIPRVYPTPETSLIQPQYPYALTKYIGELYALHWAKVYTLPVISLRFFNVFGPRSRVSDDYGPVFSTFMAQKLAHKPFTVVGDGTQRRDFTFVTDVVDACIAAAQSAVVGDVFNVGSGGTYSINHLVSLLSGPVVHIPKRPGEPDCTFADISKIKKILKWKPKISFEEGVQIVLDHIKDWKHAPVWTPKTIKGATKEWFTFLGN